MIWWLRGGLGQRGVGEDVHSFGTEEQGEGEDGQSGRYLDDSSNGTGPGGFESANEGIHEGVPAGLESGSRLGFLEMMLGWFHT